MSRNPGKAIQEMFNNDITEEDNLFVTEEDRRCQRCEKDQLMQSFFRNHRYNGHDDNEYDDHKRGIDHSYRLPQVRCKLDYN